MLQKRFFKTKDEVEVTFEVANDEIETIALVCDANEWKPVQLKKRKKDGVYYTKMRFPKDGEYQFRYLVNDSQWLNDEAADAYRPNEFGAENSVLLTSES
jgi:1,4-alpha-glucan branching enzyme